MNTPEITVVIPAFNAARWLPEQLESLVHQQGAPEFAVIVADNGSTDSTADEVQKFEDRLNISLVLAPEIKSASHARNRGVEAATSPFIAFCDADDLADPHWLAELYSAQRESGADLVSGALHHEMFNTPAFLEAYGIREDPKNFRDLPAIIDPAPPFAGYLPTAPGGNMLISRKLYNEIGGMDPNYPGGSEETAFSWAAQEHGGKLVACPRAVVHYRLKTTPGTLFRQQRIQNRAKIYLWTQNRNTSMIGPSLKSSLLEASKAGATLAANTIKGQRDLVSVRRLGGNIGALEGIFKYRILEKLKKAIPHSM